MLPFYVGKGNGRRMYAHVFEAKSKRDGEYVNNKPHHCLIREILNEGLDIIYEKVLFNVSEDQALKKERNLIEELGRINQQTGPLLNLTAGGQRGGNVNAKSVSQYDLEGNYIKDFPSAKVASEQTPANRSYITACCKNKRKSAGGFQWTYTGAPSPDIYKKDYFREVHQYSIRGEYIKTFNSLTAAAKEVNVNVRAISEACRGKTKSSGNYQWSYVKHQDLSPKEKHHSYKIKVQQLTPSGQLIAEYEKIKDAANAIGVTPTFISRCINPKYPNKTAKGFIWIKKN